jgi:hypothetical protein
MSADQSQVTAEKRVEPERYWVYRDSYHYPQLHLARHSVRPSTEYVRVDLYDKVVAERDQYKLAAEMNKETIEKMRFTEEYGCHVDLEPGQKPDSCVIDEGIPHTCIYAGTLVAQGKDKHACEYWQRIKRDRS